LTTKPRSLESVSSWTRATNTVLYKKGSSSFVFSGLISGTQCNVFSCLFGTVIDSKDGGNAFLRNVDELRLQLLFVASYRAAFLRHSFFLPPFRKIEPNSVRGRKLRDLTS
jgi:hypothetical protein